MRVIIIGCGRVGSALANQLQAKGHLVTVIDQNPAAFDNLPIDFHGRTIEGDVLSRRVLHRAEVLNADALAAVTRSDSLNALVAHLARSDYHVKRVAARNFDPRQRPLQEAFGIPVIGSASWSAQRIEEQLLDAPLREVFLDDNARFAVYQLEVPENWKGLALNELLPEEKGKVLAWVRAGQPLPISPAEELKAEDLLYLNASPQEIEALQLRLRSREERMS
jgi:trk system potassium uptake protein